LEGYPKIHFEAITNSGA